MRPEVIAIFQEVADQSAPERADYYVRHGVAGAIRAEVESLLDYDLSSDSLGECVASAERHLETSVGAHPEQPPRIDTAPGTIGRFEVTGRLGRGGMGEVYLARDPVLDRRVAIKLIHRDIGSEGARRRLVREARTAGRLRHPNIVTVFEAGEHENQSYIAMEHVPGETLGSLIRRRAPVSLRQRLEMIEGACAGLAHAHQAGVVHLDIKPDNLMLDEAGTVKVLDFGISRNLQADTLVTAHLAGTLRYMSPEQIQEQMLDHRSDVFSLGCVLFELVSYIPAFSGSTKEIVTRIAHGPVPRLLEISSHVDPNLDDVVARAMALDPADRYDTLERLRTDLAQLRGGIDLAADDPYAAVPLGVASPGDAASQRVGRSSQPRTSVQRPPVWRSRSLIAAALGAVAVTGLVAALSSGSRPPAVEMDRAAPEAPANASAAPAPVPDATLAPPAGTGDDVWRQLARGERSAVLDRLRAATRGTAADRALAGAVVDTVRVAAQRARDAVAPAARDGAAASTYRAGEEQWSRANRLADSGQSMESVRAFWEAADLYERAASIRGPSDDAPQSSPPIAVSNPPPLASASLAPTLPPVVPAPPPASPPASKSPPVTTSVAVAPLTSSIAPAPTPAAAAASRLPARSDSEAILETLRRYDAAYEARLLTAVLQVYPSMPSRQADELKVTFEKMTGYQQDTDNIRIEAAGDRATADATVTRRITPRVGLPYENAAKTQFRLRRSGNDWIIVGVDAK